MTKVISKYLLLCITLFLSVLSNAATFISDGVEIFYTDEGTGVPIILIHGYTVTADKEFRVKGLTDRLSSEFRVISIDNRGHGKSGMYHAPGAYGVQMVKDVISLMDYLKIDKSNFIGYSMGGMIINKLVSMYPERVIKAVSGGSGWSENPDLSIFKRLAELE